MARSTVNSSYALANRLIALKRHLQSCKTCKNARKASAPKSMCDVGLLMTMTCADKYDALLNIRIAARKSEVNTVIPCPDPKRHGAAYVLLATPVIAGGEYEPLF